jgi:hypothetical protein
MIFNLTRFVLDEQSLAAVQAFLGEDPRYEYGREEEPTASWTARKVRYVRGNKEQDDPGDEADTASNH